MTLIRIYALVFWRLVRVRVEVNLSRLSCVVVHAFVLTERQHS